MEKDTWVIRVAGYGAFLFAGTEQEAEQMRMHKANWEQGIGHKRLADKNEIVKGRASYCPNHPNFKHKSRFYCDCGKCEHKK